MTAKARALARAREWKRRNREKVAAYQAAWRAAHREARQAYQRDYTAKHGETLRAKKRAAYRQAHAPRPPQTEKACSKCGVVKPLSEFYRRMGRCKSCHREYGRAYQKANWPKVLERARRWRARNPERARAKDAKRRAEHPDYMRGYRRRRPDVFQLSQAKRRARKRGAEATFTTREWVALKALYGHRCVYCGTRPKRLTQDHVIPLARGGAHVVGNIVPACRSCNARKHVGPPPPYQPVLGGLLPSQR